MSLPQVEQQTASNNNTVNKHSEQEAQLSLGLLTVLVVCDLQGHPRSMISYYNAWKICLSVCLSVSPL